MYNHNVQCAILSFFKSMEYVLYVGDIKYNVCLWGLSLKRIISKSKLIISKGFITHLQRIMHNDMTNGLGGIKSVGATYQKCI